MPFFDTDVLRAELRPNFLSESKNNENLEAYAVRKLSEVSERYSSSKTYDIFLSHSVKDAPAILKLVRELEQRGFSVYVDWIVDRHLDRTTVTTATARTIRQRLKSCRSLLMALTKSSVVSSWVQWELGLGDGQKNGKVAIIPLKTYNDDNPTFYKNEYLGLYPYIDYSGSSIFVNGKNYVTLRDWLNYADPLQQLIYS